MDCAAASGGASVSAWTDEARLVDAPEFCSVRLSAPEPVPPVLESSRVERASVAGVSPVRVSLAWLSLGSASLVFVVSSNAEQPQAKSMLPATTIRNFPILLSAPKNPCDCGPPRLSDARVFCAPSLLAPTSRHPTAGSCGSTTLPVCAANCLSFVWLSRLTQSV
jgi:hypothetical protein